MSPELHSLSELAPGESAEVCALADQSPGTMRLLEMGLSPGARVRIVKRAPFGDPLEVRVVDYDLCLRRAEAQSILVRKSADADSNAV
ncbi:MAG: ferrous iron transport protein A [Leptospirales bacterium]|nr:ferrous iron transport protein A [Leptospirales bacterium]